MARLFWQRCPRCGRLTLSRLGATTICDCARGVPGPESRPQRADPLASGITPVLPAPPPIPAPPAPSLVLLTPEQDAVARRLLASVFPDGFDF